MSNSYSAPSSTMKSPPESRTNRSKTTSGSKRSKSKATEPKSTEATTTESKSKEPKILRNAPDQFFQDGTRQIDFILAYEKNEKEEKKYFRVYREFFLRKLQEQGIELERESSTTTSGEEICFIKLHAPHDTLAKFAEAIQMKLPLKNVEKPDFSEETWPEKSFRITCFKLPEDYLKMYEIRTNYAAVFRKDKQILFQPYNQITFFAPDERIQIVWYILCRTQSIPGDSWTALNSGVKRLLEKKVYGAAYPIHDGGKCFTCKRVLSQPISVWNSRRLLHRFWQSGRMRLKHQPMVLVRGYFGLTISFYFSWLGCYTRALIPPSLIGIGCFVYGLIAVLKNPVEVCDDPETMNITMCPNCPTSICENWKLKEACLFYSLILVFANETTIPYAIFITLWAAWFLVYWTRKENELKWDSQTTDTGDTEEPLRIEYEEKASSTIQNPVTHRPEPHVRKSVIFFRRFVSVTATLILIFSLIFIMFALIFIRFVLLKALHYAFKKYRDQQSGGYDYHQHFRILSMIISSTLSLIVIIAAELTYERVARRLTNFELPRTMSDYETSFIYKVVAFQFINYYLPIVYIAFMKGRLHSAAIIEDYGFFTVENCAIGGCMSEIAIQLIFTMCIKQFLSTIKEVGFPRLVRAGRKMKKFMWKTKKRTQWEKDFALVEIPELPLVDEYIEMVIQFGFVTMFSVAFPLAALFALINNLFEIRSDAKKWTYVYRRPVPQLARDIGPWFLILKSIAVLSILTNGCIVAFTSDIVPRIVYYTQYGFQDSGYFNHSLSSFTLDDNVTCFYADYREPSPPYKKTIVWWHVFAARLLFLTMFLVLTNLFQRAVFVLSPSVPKALGVHWRREQYLAWNAFYGTESRVMNDQANNNDINQPFATPSKTPNTA